MNPTTGKKGVRIREMSPVQAAYLAGIIDGEGSIRLCRPSRDGASSYYQPCVSLGTTSRELLEWVVLATGFGRSNVPHGGRAVRSKPAWQWVVHSRKAICVIRAVAPYLLIKVPQAKLLLEYAELTKMPGERLTRPDMEARESIYHQMRDLNRRGRQQVTDKTCHTPEPVLAAA